MLVSSKVNGHLSRATMSSQLNTVSVVLATFNGGKYLRAQLESIARQTLPVQEVVVGDDGSEDDTIQILEEYQRPDHPLTLPLQIVRHERKMGPAKNFEFLMRASKCDIILFSDQDDIWNPDRVSRSVKALQATDADYVFGDAQIIDEASRPTGQMLWNDVFFSKGERDSMRNGSGFDVLLRHNVVTGATLGIQRRVLDWVLPLAEGWMHDGWIALIAEAVGTSTMIEDPVIAYRRHRDQQIGAVGLHPVRLARFIGNQKRSGLEREARAYRQAASRLLQVGGGAAPRPGLDARVAQLEAKAAFLELRARGRGSSRIRRLLDAHFTESARGYRSFSLGWKTFVVDLLAPRGND